MPRTTQQQPQANSDSETSYDIIAVKDWNVPNLVCGAAKPNKSGQGKSGSLTYKSGISTRRFYLKVPKMQCPFGASKPKPKPGEKEKENEQYSMQLTFTDDEVCQEFQKKVLEFDEFMINEGLKPENNVGWLGASKSKPFNRDVVEVKYTKMMKYSKDKNTGEISKQYPPFIRATLPTTFKAPYSFTCEIYDKSNNLLSASLDPQSPDYISKVIPPFCWCSALLSGSIWCNSNGYGVTWRVAQLKVFPPRGVIPKGKCLVSDPDDEEEDEKEEKEEKKEEDGEEVDGDEVDIDDGEVIETTPAPAAVKKVVTAKK